MSNEKAEINQYYMLGKLFGKNIENNKIAEFVEHYLTISLKSGSNELDILNDLKDKSMQLNDAIMTSCVNLQNELRSQKTEDYSRDRVTINQAAEIYAVTPATIRNWIKNETNPLEALNVGIRQTTVSIKALKEYTLKLGKSKKK
jgi:hypothetical protein